MKPVCLLFLAFAIPSALPGATASSPAAAAADDDASDLTSLRAKAERGNAVAQYNLGLAHLQGRQTPINLLEAYAWLTLAAEGGSTGRALGIVLDTLTPEQLAAAKRRLETLRAGNPPLRAGSAAAAAKAPAAGGTPIIGETPVVRPAPATTPIIAIPSGAGPAAQDTRRLQEQLAVSDQERRQLASELGSAWKEIEQLKAQLAARATAAADTTALQAQLRDAQAALARHTNELATARAEASAARNEQTKLQSQLTSLRETLAARNGAASQASDARIALDKERAAHAATQSSLGQLKTQVADLTAARAQLESDAANRLTVAERAQAAAAEEAKKFSAQSADLARQVAVQGTELKTARTELASLRQSLATAEEKNTATRNELAQTKTALEAATSRAKTAASRADAGAQAESQLSTLRNQVTAIERDLESFRNTSHRLTGEKSAVEATLARANQKLAETTQELNALRERTANRERQANASAEQKIGALQAELNETKSRLAAAVAARPAESAASKDDVSRALADAENKLSTALRSYMLVTQERDALQTRVAELSASVSSTKDALTNAETRAKVATESMTASVASTAELETLRNRAAAAERAAETAQAELARANQLLAAYRPAPTTPTRPPMAPAGEPARTHTIATGETLSSISLRYYGTAARWPEILAANRDVLVDEHSFAVGRTLRIP
jgi:nucleoid-associated protein YgaU